MRYRPSFLREVERFERASTTDGQARNECGLRQFYDRESRGVEPTEPDGYFQRLLDGKRWWEWTVNEYAKLYGTWEWPGWEMLKEDFRDDPAGLRQIRQRLRMDYDHSCA